MEIDDSLFGVDYSSKGGVTATGDIELVGGLDNAKQSIYNQMLTEKGTYPSIDTEYGSEVYEVLGEDFEDNGVEALKIYIQNVLYANPRVQIINDINPVVTVDKKLVMNINVELVNGQNETFNIGLEEMEQ